jgi:hypothetical protein
MSTDSRKSLPSRSALYLLEKELAPLAPLATVTALPVPGRTESLPVAA